MLAAPWHATVQPAVDEVMATHDVPGMVIALAQGAGPPEYLVTGADGLARPLAADTLFPVASITKLATALAVLRLADAGALTVEDPLDRHLPDAAAAGAGIRLVHLFTHTSGLSGDYPEALAPRTPELTWAGVARASLQTPPSRPPGASVEYSNLNYSLLAVVVERVTGRAFPAALRELALAPLSIEGSLGAEPPRSPAHIAGVPADQYTGTPLERTNSAFHRSLGSPYGGLVTTAAGALALVRAFGGLPSAWLRPATRAAATRDQTGGLGGGFPSLQYERCPWGLGPELLGGKRPHWAPPEASPATFGHYGATGCCAWADPPAGLAWAILTTRMPVGLASRAIMSSIGAAILAAVRHQ